MLDLYYKLCYSIKAANFGSLPDKYYDQWTRRWCDSFQRPAAHGDEAFHPGERQRHRPARV